MAGLDTGAPAVDTPADPVAQLGARTGFDFPDRALALAALTHKSYVNEHRDEGLSDNERLEFLGDAVLDLAVSQLLMDRFPRAREGELSKIRAALVDEPALARQGREMGLGPLLRLGRGELLTGGREKASLLADALEAVIAVMYLGGGMAPVLAFLAGTLAGAFQQASAGTLDRDYKTQLQETAQSRMRATPRYRVVAQSGPDHERVFEVELELRGEVLGRGTGRSKKDAEQGAARQALEALATRGGPAPSPVPTPVPVPGVAEAGAAGSGIDAPAGPPTALVEPVVPAAPAPEVGEGAGDLAAPPEAVRPEAVRPEAVMPEAVMPEAVMPEVPRKRSAVRKRAAPSRAPSRKKPGGTPPRKKPAPRKRR